MSTFGNFILNLEYADLAARGGDPLLGISSMIDWERFRPLLSLAYRSDTELGGHPHTCVMVGHSPCLTNFWIRLLFMSAT